MTTGHSTMTKADAKREIRQMQAFFKKEITSKEKAHDYLVKVGIVDKSGKVSKRYRG